MNKKLLLGSVLVFTSLLLMPSIPAIQQNIVKDDVKDRILSELTEVLNYNDIKELVDSGKLDNIRHPLLYRFVTAVLLFKIKLTDFAYNKAFDSWEYVMWIADPVWFIIYLILFTNVVPRAFFWYCISETLRWNWNLEEVLD